MDIIGNGIIKAKIKLNVLIRSLYKGRIFFQGIAALDAHTYLKEFPV